MHTGLESSSISFPNGSSKQPDSVWHVSKINWWPWKIVQRDIMYSILFLFFFVFVFFFFKLRRLGTANQAINYNYIMAPLRGLSYFDLSRASVSGRSLSQWASALYSVAIYEPSIGGIWSPCSLVKASRASPSDNSKSPNFHLNHNFGIGVATLTFLNPVASRPIKSREIPCSIWRTKGCVREMTRHSENGQTDPQKVEFKSTDKSPKQQMDVLQRQSFFYGRYNEQW